MKFGCCDVCTYREESFVCEECEDADHFEPDESLIEIGPDGRASLSRGAVTLHMRSFA